MARGPRCGFALAGQPRFDLLMRLGMLEEQSLEQPAKALVHYRQAFAIPVPTQDGHSTEQPTRSVSS